MEVIHLAKFNPAVILRDLEGIPYAQDVRETYPGSAHKDVEKIWIREPVDKTINGAMSGLACEDSEINIQSIRLLVATYKASLGFAEVGRVMVAKLKAGGHILPHIDQGDYALHYSRFHAVLTGSCMWSNESGGFKMDAGNVYYTPNTIEHEVFGGPERIALIFDLGGPDD